MPQLHPDRIIVLHYISGFHEDNLETRLRTNRRQHFILNSGTLAYYRHATTPALTSIWFLPFKVLDYSYKQSGTGLSSEVPSPE